jgi:adenine-specific DNA methylase
LVDPCAGPGDLIIAGYRAGRQVLAVTDRPTATAVAGLGQGMLFDPAAD